MKPFLIFFLFLCSCSYGQQLHNHNPYNIRVAFDAFNREDSLDGLFINIHSLHIISDTIPVFSEADDTRKNLEILHFFYDASNVLKRVLYRNGSNGDYYFYFDNSYLKKVRYRQYGNMVDSTCYFTIKDNEYTLAQIEQKIKNAPEQKVFFDLLALSKTFLYKFNMLL